MPNVYMYVCFFLTFLNWGRIEQARVFPLFIIYYFIYYFSTDGFDHNYITARERERFETRGGNYDEEQNQQPSSEVMLVFMCNCIKSYFSHKKHKKHSIEKFFQSKSIQQTGNNMIYCRTINREKLLHFL
jgi:hypothetical protein